MNSTIRTINITSLTAPTVSNLYTGPTLAIDHNGYTIGNKFYFSNYTRGIGILDVTNPNAPVQLSYFDTYPTTNSATFAGAWGVYPYLPSGNILISDIQRGLIVVREQSAAPPPTATITNTPVNTLTPSNTPTPTRTPTPTNTSSAGNTGFLIASANASQSGGDGNGYQTNPTNAYTDNSVFAVDTDSGKNSNSSCTNAVRINIGSTTLGSTYPVQQFWALRLSWMPKLTVPLARPNYVSSYPGMLAPVGRLPNKLAR